MPLSALFVWKKLKERFSLIFRPKTKMLHKKEEKNHVYFLVFLNFFAFLANLLE
jgi:hypothetical protein